jgi:antitoxin component YwqK of YwqJK toxin-antitoxin module
MKQIFLLFTVFFFFQMSIYAQHIDGNSGKTYYDTGRTKLKEVYSYKEKTTFSVTGDHSVANVTQIKHGPYFYYYEGGKLKISGNFKNDKKDGIWKYYDENGKMIKSETYLNGELK